MAALPLWLHQALHNSHYEREQQRWVKLERRFEGMILRGMKKPAATPEALRRAIEKGETRAGRRRYRAVGLMRYAAWGLSHQRHVAVG